MGFPAWRIASDLREKPGKGSGVARGAGAARGQDSEISA